MIFRPGACLCYRGKAGVTNVGNTCFLGSALQCLSHVRPLTQHILSNQFKKDVNLNNPLGKHSVTEVEGPQSPRSIRGALLERAVLKCEM